jgi:hypothetical protein
MRMQRSLHRRVFLLNHKIQTSRRATKARRKIRLISARIFYRAGFKPLSII